MDPRELNHLFEQMSPAPEQEEAILARLQAPEKAVKNPSRRWKKSVFVLTAAAAMTLACAAAAFSALDPRLLSFFQRTPQDTELLGEGVVEVNQSHTYENGWTVSVRQALAADFADQLGELGISCTIEGVGWDTAYDRALSEPLIWGWGAHTPMELYNIYHTEGDTGSAQYSPYANKTVDEYMDQALAVSDLEESYELWQKAQWDGTTGVTQEGDIPWVWLVNIDHLYWVRDGLRVAEQKIHPHGHGWSVVNNVDQWTWS